MVQLGGLDEDEIGLRLPWSRDLALHPAGVQKLALRRVVAPEDEAIIPPAEIADDLQVARPRGEAGALAGREVFRKPPEHAVHCHQQILLADLADARPFDVPTVGAVVSVARLRESIGMPLALVEHGQDERAEVPSGGPHRIGLRLRVAVNPARPGDLGVLIPPHNRPAVRLAVPRGQHARGDRRVA